MPDLPELPCGPHRAFVENLHGFYVRADHPALRTLRKKYWRQWRESPATRRQRRSTPPVHAKVVLARHGSGWMGYSSRMRLGVLDIGSNSAQLLVVDARPGAPPLPAHAVKESTLLGELIEPDGSIGEDGVQRVAEAVARAVVTALPQR
jgi:hypothetical protein